MLEQLELELELELVSELELEPPPPSLELINSELDVALELADAAALEAAEEFVVRTGAAVDEICGPAELVGISVELLAASTLAVAVV